MDDSTQECCEWPRAGVLGELGGGVTFSHLHTVLAEILFGRAGQNCSNGTDYYLFQCWEAGCRASCDCCFFSFLRQCVCVWSVVWLVVVRLLNPFLCKVNLSPVQICACACVLGFLFSIWIIMIDHDDNDDGLICPAPAISK